MLAAALMLAQTTKDVSPGLHLSYSDTGGSGVPIVLMHAATGSIRSCAYQTSAFVKAGHRVIAFDRRGWGGTTVDPNVAAGTAADDLSPPLDSLPVGRV